MRRARILLVDDNKVNRKLLAAVLEADGYRVEEAGSGREAVEGVRLLSYDLVLMDVQMPDMDGVEATAAIRSLGGRRADVPIVAISGDIGDDIAERCRAAGMNDHLGKPVNPETLQRVVAQWTRPAGEGGQARPAAPGSGSGQGETPLLGGLAAHLSGAALLPIIDEFSEGAAARVAEIERDASAGDLDRVRRIAHDLSGSAANLGLTGLSRLARSIEIASSESDVATVRRLVAAVPDLLRQVLADLARTRAAAAAGGPSRSAAAGDDIHPGGP